MKKPDNIIQAALEGHKAVTLIVVGLVLVGLLGIWKMNKDEFPQVEVLQGLVAGIYPGASAEEVEEGLAKPLEEVLLGCPEVERHKLKSVSKDGICYLYVTIQVPQYKVRQTWTDIRFKLQTRKLTLPTGVLAVVLVDDFSSISSLLISMASDDKGWSEMSEYADELKRRLLSIEDVAKVSILGEQKEEIAVIADMDRMASYGISPALLNVRYTLDGLRFPAGKFTTEYANAPIYVGRQMTSEEDIAKKVVFSDPQGGIIRVEDVATVERRVMEKASSVKYNGNNTLLLSVSMRSDRDIVAFGAKIDKVLSAFEEDLPDSVHLSRITDQPKVVRTSIVNFIRDLLISILVVILVMLALFPFNCAIVASTGVPVCTAIAIAIMYLAGMPLNTVTLAALIVVLGMIVDDSIVTMDGYMDKLRLGMPRNLAAVAAAKELARPMFMATLSISLTLFPMLFIVKSNLHDVFSLFPWVLMIALMTSLAYALFVIPSLEVKFISSPSEAKKPGKFAQIQEKFFAGLQNIYDKAEVACFKKPGLTLLSGVLLVAASVFIFTKINIQLLPKATRDLFVIEVNLEEGSSLRNTQTVADSLTSMIMADSRVKDVTTFVGSSAPRFHATYAPSLPSETYAQLIVNTVSDRATTEMVRECEQKYEYYFPNALIRVKEMDYQGVVAPYELSLSSTDRSQLYAAADSIAAYMRTQNDILKWVHTDYAFRPGVCVDLKPEEAARLEVNPAELAASLYQDFASTSLLSYSEGGRGDVPVILYSKTATDTMTYDAIGNKLVGSVIPGVNVPLRQVADINPVWEPSQLVRTGGFSETVSVSADIKSGRSHSEAVRRVGAWLKENKHLIPEGVTVKEGGLTALNREYGPQLLWSFAAALLVMFVFLLLHFRKISISVLTMALSALCLFGSFLGLYVFNLDFSMTALLGLISLIGIIVRNGIMMFEYAEELHFVEGKTYREAALLAGQRRMRPIFLTSCTTAFGVLPMIISADALWMPMGVVICLGVMLTLPFVVLIMPVSYWQLFAKKDAIKEVEKDEEKQ